MKRLTAPRGVATITGISNILYSISCAVTYCLEMKECDDPVSNKIRKAEN